MKIGILGGGGVGGALARSAKEIVADLIRAAGFDPVDAGDHAQAADLEAFARLVIGIAYRQGQGPFVYRFASQ